MKKKAALFLCLTGTVWYCLSFQVRRNVTAPEIAEDQTQAILKATYALVNSLSSEQRAKILFPISSQQKAIAAKFKHSGIPKYPAGGGPKDGNMLPKADSGKTDPLRGNFPDFIGEQYGAAIWSNYPVSDVPRPGLQLGNLSAMQRDAVMHLLHELLSTNGYEKVLQIMGSDQALADGGTNFVSGKDSYTIAIFGTPSNTKRWMVEFGGHHLGLNVIIAGSQGTLTPTLTGAQPAVYTSNGKIVRVLAAENDKAFDLLNSLDTNQRASAILNYSVGDLVLGPGHDGEVIVPEGLKGSTMTQSQKKKLVDLILQWTGIMNEAYLQARMVEVKKSLDDTYFAWSGPTTHEAGKNGSAYYRIQGPRVIIEFSPQGVGGDPTMHVHTIYRDPANEYGMAFLK